MHFINYQAIIESIVILTHVIYISFPHREEEQKNQSDRDVITFFMQVCNLINGVCGYSKISTDFLKNKNLNSDLIELDYYVTMKYSRRNH